MWSRSLDSTHDEDGKERWFIADENADWVAGPFDFQGEAADELEAMESECEHCGERITTEQARAEVYNPKQFGLPNKLIHADICWPELEKKGWETA